MTVPAVLPEPGAILGGKYRIERLLGRGGMGVVFAAQHEILRQRVAVKLLLAAASSPEGLQRFINEARAAAQLDSEHIARVMDMGTLDNGMPFMVLEYLEGSDLGQLLSSRGPLPVVEVVDYVLQACEALAQAHAAGIIHRDLKPSNLYIARRPDGTTRVKVLDFGISKVSDPSIMPKALTSTSAMLGTPYYMSPEQMVRPKQVDSRTDVWQLGVTIFELLQGSPPFGGDTLGELMFAVLNQPLPYVSQSRADVPPEVDAVIHRCLDRDVIRRFANVAELATALAPFGSGIHNHLIEKMTRTLAAKPPFAVTPGGGGTLRVQGDWVASAQATPMHARPPLASSQGARPLAGSGAGAGRSPSQGTSPVVETGRSWGQASGPEAPASSKVPVIIGATVGAIGIGVAVVLVVLGHGHGPMTASSVTPAATPPSALASAAAGSSAPAASSVASAPAPGPAVAILGTPTATAASATASAKSPPPKAWAPMAGRGAPPRTGPKVAPDPPTAATKSADQLPDNSRQ
jgi:eukaryotic-like serine/threonine-protein kinase